MRYDYNPEPDSGSPADRWRSLDSEIVEEMSLIIDSYLLKYSVIGMMRRKHEIFAMLLKRHPEAEEEVTSYFWEGVRLQKNGFEWRKGHPLNP